MNFSIPFMMRSNGYSDYVIPVSYKTLNQALSLIKQAAEMKKESELFYDYLISAAPTNEERSIITTIRDDEKKHITMFKEIYRIFASQELVTSEDIQFEKPTSYIDCIKKAKFSELNSMELCRNIRAGVPDRYFRDMLFEMLTNEFKHSSKFDYILNLILENKLNSKPMLKDTATTPRVNFTTEEAAKVAKALGIDFSKEKFDVEQFKNGMNVELEHGRRSSVTNVTNDDPILTGKIALAHLKEFPDYYIRLKKLEEEATAYWKNI
ncbi:DUF5661 family protein [Clostridium sp. DJ247]|uniref:DUF5661 family protein n=1 Tax=Clostridium sp. DJ247 TaxID=2726188 RepID=UPI001F4CF162|nr:DUF5661 family protein [Clostridium sp. DJ247]